MIPMKIFSNKAKVEEDSLISQYTSSTSIISQTNNDGVFIDVIDKKYEFKTDLKIPKLGLMMVGWGGNNGTTITGGFLANKHAITWEDKKGVHHPNFLGSVTQSSTLKVV